MKSLNYVEMDGEEMTATYIIELKCSKKRRATYFGFNVVLKSSC